MTKVTVKIADISRRFTSRRHLYDTMTESKCPILNWPSHSWRICSVISSAPFPILSMGLAHLSAGRRCAKFQTGSGSTLQASTISGTSTCKPVACGSTRNRLGQVLAAKAFENLTCRRRLRSACSSQALTSVFGGSIRRSVQSKSPGSPAKRQGGQCADRSRRLRKADCQTTATG